MGFSGVCAISIFSVRDGHCVASFQRLSMPTKPTNPQLATRPIEFSSARRHAGSPANSFFNWFRTA
jgi:hypothetical protein